MTQFLSFRSLIGFVSIAVAMIALFGASPLKAFSSTLQRAGFDWYNSQKDVTSPIKTNAATKAPVYFFSHGGPDVQYNTKHPVYPFLQQIGREITQKVKPKATLLSFMTSTGSPITFIKLNIRTRVAPELASKIMVMLSEAGIQSYGMERGLDHGVFSGFHVAFNPETNPLNVPLVQVSLFKNEDPHAHYALGRAVSALRDEGIVIIGAGMSVHNLRDMYHMFEGNTEPLPYVVSFDNALKEAVEADPAIREEKMAAIFFIAAGAASEDWGKQIWTLHEGSFGWSQFRFGDVPSS
ncbi:Extradiol ring-cleavage dioxygenase, class III enzyme, subunit B [Fusarium oxysporum f. sp. vasinfectum]|nr:Extradiol ring-cleavage dioxygenase, class III enzyme, subunit B [Fusarium oxysporum f. sp. vasinfectum]